MAERKNWIRVTICDGLVNLQADLDSHGLKKLERMRPLLIQIIDILAEPVEAGAIEPPTPARPAAEEAPVPGPGNEQETK